MTDESGSRGDAGIWSKPRAKWLLGIPVGGFIMIGVGSAGLGTVNYVAHETSTTEFCFQCHSHEVNIRPEYEASAHFSNASGVRAECADCHLPQDNWFEYMYTKVVVSLDIIPELAGKLDTPEKYEAHRGEMAEAVWAQYQENDSRFCRSCHTAENMDLTKQPENAAAMHGNLRSGKTCIDCHKGIVHALPQSSGHEPSKSS